MRALIPNLLSSEFAKIEIAVRWDIPTLQIAIRCPSMAFANRLPANTNPGVGRRVLEAELANILNLGWFDAGATSPDAAHPATSFA